jgi:hypothetical protein
MPTLKEIHARLTRADRTTRDLPLYLGGRPPQSWSIHDIERLIGNAAMILLPRPTVTVTTTPAGLVFVVQCGDQTLELDPIEGVDLENARAAASNFAAYLDRLLKANPANVLKG